MRTRNDRGLSAVSRRFPTIPRVLCLALAGVGLGLGEVAAVPVGVGAWSNCPGVVDEAAEHPQDGSIRRPGECCAPGAGEAMARGEAITMGRAIIIRHGCGQVGCSSVGGEACTGRRPTTQGQAGGEQQGERPAAR